MNKYLTTATLSFALIAVAPAYAEEPQKEGHAHEHTDKHAEKKADEPTVKKGPKQPSADTKSAQSIVDSEVDKLRENIISDAVDAVVESNKALMFLEKNQPKDALSAIETAVGKLKDVLEREPALGLKPIHVSKTVHDLQADPAIIKKKVEAAEKHLKEGELQHARMLISSLASDITISTTSIPLKTYPDGLKAVVPLIDEGKIAEAKVALKTLLSTLITKEMVIPLPPLRAEGLLMAAETLVENEKRTEEENKQLEALLTQAHNEIKMAEALGYGDKKAFKPMHKLINDIEKKIAEGKGGKGWFDGIKQAWGSLFSAQESAK